MAVPPYLEAHKLYDSETMNALQLRYITPDEVMLTPKLLKRWPNKFTNRHVSDSLRKNHADL